MILFLHLLTFQLPKGLPRASRGFAIYWLIKRQFTKVPRDCLPCVGYKVTVTKSHLLRNEMVYNKYVYKNLFENINNINPRLK